MKTALAVLAFVALASTSVASAEPADPLAPAPAVSVGSFAYAMNGYLSSTPAVLTGFDATYDHDLAPRVGLRVRAGAVVLAVEEITGMAPHGEAGAFTRHALLPRLALDVSLLAGFYGGGLDHKQAWQDHAGPTAMAEVALHMAMTDHLHAAIGGGYRLAWTADEHMSDAGSASDPFSSGPLVRFDLGWSF